MAVLVYTYNPESSTRTRAAAATSILLLVENYPRPRRLRDDGGSARPCARVPANPRVEFLVVTDSESSFRLCRVGRTAGGDKVGVFVRLSC